MSARAEAAWAWPALAVACGLVIAACYVPGLPASFQMDDTVCISSNASIRSLARLDEILFYSHQEGRPIDGRPLLNLSLAINRAIVGTSPAAFRSVNILLHWLAACLLLDVVRRLLILPTMPEFVRRRRLAITFVAVLAWALHPLQTAAVTYVIQRSEILAAIFLLAGLDLTVAGLVGGRLTLLPAVGAAATIGGAAKETIVSLPLVTALIDRALIARSWREAARHWTWHLAAAAGWPVVVLMLTVWGGRGSSAGLGSASPWLYLLRQAKVIWIYLGQIVWPGELVFDYGDRLGVGLATDWPWLVATTLLFFGVCICFGRWPRIFLGPLLFFVLLGPTSSIIPVMTQTAGEHRLYLATAALIVPAIVGLTGLGDRCRVPAWLQAGLVAIVLVGLATRTAARNAEYLSSEIIWRQSLAFDSANERAAINLATAALDRNDLKEASRLLAGVSPAGRYRLAVLSNAARLAIKTGRLTDAVAACDAYLADTPHDAEIHAMRGSVYRRLGNLQAAAADVDQALAIDAEVAMAWTTRGDLLVDAGKPAEAIDCFQRSLAIDPDRWAAWSSQGVALQQLGRTAEALAAFERAIALKPNEAEPYYNRGNLFAAENLIDQAAVDYGRALACDPSSRDAAHNRCVVLARLGRIAEARADFERFLRLGGRPSPVLAELLGGSSATKSDPSPHGSSPKEVVSQDAP